MSEIQEEPFLVRNLPYLTTVFDNVFFSLCITELYNVGPVLIIGCCDVTCFWLQEYPGDELLLVYDYDFKYGENFYIAMTEEAKDKIMNVSSFVVSWFILEVILTSTRF